SGSHVITAQSPEGLNCYACPNRSSISSCAMKPGESTGIVLFVIKLSVVGPTARGGVRTFLRWPVSFPVAARVRGEHRLLLFRNQQVTRSSRVAGSTLNPSLSDSSRLPFHKYGDCGQQVHWDLSGDHAVSRGAGWPECAEISRRFSDRQHEQLMIYQQVGRLAS
ncbi:MAG: hypothetical protein ABJA98_11705, partial [Acidobacteriota bacterium]